MKPEVDYTLYLVTDHGYLNGRDFYFCIEEALKGGVTLVQLREKNRSKAELLTIARELQALCAKYHVPLIINDYPEIAAAVHAAGVHVGQSDASAQYARRLLGPEAIIGVSAYSEEAIVRAVAAGADYVGVGAVYPTGTKDNVAVLGTEGLRRLCAVSPVPVVAIGGVGLANCSKVKSAGASGMAIVSDILAQQDIAGRCREIVAVWRNKE